MNRITILNPAKRWPGEQEKEKAWTDIVQSSPPLDVYEKGLAVRLQEMGCDAARGPYLISGFLLNPISARFLRGSAQWNALATAFLDKDHCPAARALSHTEKLSLQVMLQITRPNSKLRPILAQAATCFNSEYSAPEAKPIRAHVPLDPTEATPEQLVDPSFARPRGSGDQGDLRTNT